MPTSPSIVTVQLGQCGNQVGCELFRTLSRELFGGAPSNSTSSDELSAHQEIFFRELKQSKSSQRKGIDNDRVARAVLVDMEPKVIQVATQRATLRRQQQVSNAGQKQVLRDESSIDDGDWFNYSSNRSFYKQSGSGNNWAFGYSIHGPQSYEEGVGDIIRKEVECCDSFGGFLFLQSLAGGTGSGVGTYITERLRDEYPSSFMINQVVWPYQDGEVIVQNYNALLTLASLQQRSDAVVVFENDQLNLTCTRLLGIRSPSFIDMNKVIASNLAMALLPCTNNQTGRPMRLFHDIVDHLCCHPCFKMLSCRSIPNVAARARPFSSFLWKGLAKHVHQMVITDAKVEEGVNWHVKLPTYPPRSRGSGADTEDDDDDDGEGSDEDVNSCASPLLEDRTSSNRRQDINMSLANMLFMRGTSATNAYKRAQILANPILYGPWSPENPLLVCSTERNFNGLDKAICALSNSQSIINPLNRVITKASEMFHAGAHLYQYQKNGIDQDTMVECFAELEQVLQSYSSLSSSG